MPVATAHTVSLHGAEGHLIDVQVDVSQGVVNTTLVGRPDAAIIESRDRCRAALNNSDLEWPATRRVTILLSPADLPKRGPHFDLAISMGVLGATGVVPARELRNTVMIGELTLDGRLRAAPGVLPMVLAASRRGIARVVVPEPQASEAALVPGMEVLGVRSLAQVVAVLRDEDPPEAPPVDALSGAPRLSWRGERRLEELDLADVVGMPDERFALEVAAAGGHHLMLSGPKGAGKTTLAERLPTLLPDLDVTEALELTAIHSLSGTLPPGAPLLVRPPFSAPHHSATRSSILGGGSGRIRPGEVSRAHLGVLFLDEFPLFQADVIDALRQPLECGEIFLSRGEESGVFPARSLVVLAANPCPCGRFHPRHLDNTCDCGELRRREYRRKMSAPVLDRIDITRHVEPVGAKDPFALREDSVTVRARVALARDRAAERYAGMQWRLNADVPGPALTERWPMTDKATRLLDERLLSGELSRRGAVRVHRMCWTIADLRGLDRPGAPEFFTALALRTGAPLPSAALAVVDG